MNKFLLKLMYFTLILLLYWGVNIMINSFVLKRNTLKITERLLIVGDSHTQRGVNPKLFESAKNISQSAEPYVLTYWKLKEILKTNNPDTIIIGFAPHNISAFNDLKFFKEPWVDEMMKRSYQIENFKELENRLLVNWAKYYQFIFKQLAAYPHKQTVTYIGSFNNTKNSTIAKVSTDGTIRRHYYTEGIPVGNSEVASSYLDSLINICIYNRIVPIVVSPPVHETYLKQIPSSTMEFYDERVKELSNSGIIVIDKLRGNYSDTLFFDADHLNEYGANRFTLEILEIIEDTKKF